MRMRTAVYGRELVAAPTAAEASELDRTALTSVGVPEPVLMENAGRSTALLLNRLFPLGRIVGVVGSGHNGGDAFVLLRNLAAWGRDVSWVSATHSQPPSALLHGFDIPRPEDMELAFAGAAVLVDGILGTGATGPPRAQAADAIARMNASRTPILAIDLPSGVDASTGRVPGPAVRAKVTVTIGSPKLGLMLQPARDFCGRLIAIEIGFPPAAHAPALLITPEWADRRRPRRAPDGHKGTSGRLLILGGRPGMAGAAAIATKAALRAGAGLVYVASDPENRVVLQRLAPEAIFVDRDDEAALTSAVRQCSALVAGPGMGTDDTARSALERTIASSNVPLLLDADALTYFASDRAALRREAELRPLLLTPHPGEMARLAGTEVTGVLEDRVAVARASAAEYGCVVLLKGAPSIVAHQGPLLVGTTGSSDLATAGMGDQLAGAIGAFLAAGVEPADAAALGLFYGGRAADLAELDTALSPMDVSRLLPRAFRSPGRREAPFHLPFVSFDQPARH
jgi:hydroxyethylthiazole kinase-like uncharacterized protein yjeF